mmetsp:Transcript_71749/g.149812  ORF Transcript_71749/g.149812 Transcript_71749/m.149812 type:complete len:118 (-) Transcript_71749:114-467(-)
MTDQCIFLCSSLSTDQIQVVNSRRLEDTLVGRKIQCEKIDGSLVENKEVRDVLFGVSNMRGKYPQCFLKSEDGSFHFVGLWDEVESLIECDTLPEDVLSANPDIKTFTKVFANAQRT